MKALTWIAVAAGVTASVAFGMLWYLEAPMHWAASVWPALAALEWARQALE
jgi:hypothetical protein